MMDLKKYLDALAGPDHPFSKGIPVEGLVELKDENQLRDGLDETTRLALNQFLRLN
jgi:hypothetical protein